MNDEKLICEMCGREVNDGDYITSPEGDIVCKCCAFDALEDSYYALTDVVCRLRNALGAAAAAMVDMKNDLDMVCKDALEQIREYRDADDTETDA